MRVCILHNSSPGGAQRLVYEVATRLARTDEVTVCTWGDAPEPALPGVGSVWCPGPPVHLRPPLHPLGDLVRSFWGSSRAARAVDAGEFDVALVFACQWAQAPEALRRLRTPSLYFAQEGRRRSIEIDYRPRTERTGLAGAFWSVGRRAYDAAGSRLDRRAITSAPAVAANSPFTAGQLAAAYGISARVVELGVDVSQFRPGPAASRRAVALLVGALDPTKRGELAVRSLALVPPEHRPALRLIANRGDESYGAKLLEIGRSIGVDVKILWNIPEAELNWQYQTASLLLALAINEPFGLTVLEATASGIPSVAVNEGGFLRTVDPMVNGILVRVEAAEVASAVARIMRGECRFDPSAMAAWARERWSWDRCIEELRQLLESLSRRAAANATRPEGNGLHGAMG